MPIHDQSYQRYHGTRAAHGSGWSVITLAGVRRMVSVRPFVLVLLFAWAPFLVRAVLIYLAANFPQMDMLAPTPATFRDFFDQQALFVFVVTVYVGAGLIANDRRANALQIYLSKPLTRVEYVAGKLGVLVVFLWLVTWTPATVLLALEVVFAGSLAFVREHAFLVPAITLYALLQVAVVSLVILALSSLSTSARFVGIVYAGVLFFSQAASQTLTAVTGRNAYAWLSINDSLAQVGDVIFRVEPSPRGTPWGVSLLALATVMAVSVWVLERRIRGVEVVT